MKKVFGVQNEREQRRFVSKSAAKTETKIEIEIETETETESTSESQLDAWINSRPASAGAEQ